MAGLNLMLKQLYEGDDERAHRFYYALLCFDLATLAVTVVSSFMPREPLVEGIDVLICIAVTADFLSRLTICPRPAREFLRPTTWADLAAIASFLARVVCKGAGFLRTYKVLDHLRSGFSFLRRNEEVIVAAVNLAVFAFVIMGIVFATQHGRNRAIGNYVNALSYTVTSLTTAGYGDVTLHGTGGPLISVVVMICGVTLFLGLAQVLF